MHRILIDPASIPANERGDGPDNGFGGPIVVDGDEAQHAARVKRLGVGAAVECLDGEGARIEGEISTIDRLGKGAWRLVIEPTGMVREPELVPRLTVCSAVPKGPRVGEMIEQLCQVGAASWGPLHSKRSVVDPRAGKLARLDRIARESIKQSGRAHALRIEPAVTLRELVGAIDGRVIVADASGGAYEPSGDDEITLLVGPEGGWTDEEFGRLRAAGAEVCRFGRHVMRIETAAVVASAVVLEREAKQRGSG